MDPAEKQALLSASDQIDDVHETHVRHASSSNSSFPPSHFHKCSTPRANSGPITLSTVWMKWHCQVNESGTYEGRLIRDQAAVTAVHTVNARARNIR